ncbi:MAG TPA: DNA mismatch repair protein MutS [Acholeplasmataceae bacterium]|nr:DNA mismatch repair protein MutS [Acholeplasmataceae bacterium]
MAEDIKQTYTPMIQQYLKIKEDYADALVFFRLGDFYELFFDDAIIASKVLEIVLTSRDAGSKIPMAGVPHHSVKPYIQKLIEKGFKIAIVEQTSEPGKGLVEREVVRLITPGTIFEDDYLDSGTNNFIASLILTEHGYLLTYADISTGESYIIANLTKNEALDKIYSLNIKELVLKEDFDKQFIDNLSDNNIYITIHKESNLHDTNWSNHLDNLYKSGPRHLLSYLSKTQMQTLSHLQPIEVEVNNKFMKVDYKVKTHLEILTSQTNNLKTTLINTINNTNTSVGLRRLRHHLSYPLTDEKVLLLRQSYIEALTNARFRDELIEQLTYIYDINRIVGRVSFNSVNARDLYHLLLTLQRVNPLKEILFKYENDLLTELANKLDSHDDLINLLEKAVIEEPPLTIKDGGIIKDGYHEKLDELRQINENITNWLTEFEQGERDRTGIKNLKIGYNKVFGYYIEISKGSIHLVKDEFNYERKQTLTNNERYISPILKEKEDEILNAKEKAINLEYELFVEIRNIVLNHTNTLQILSSNIADLDVYLSHSITALKNNYVKPTFNSSNEVNIINGRHPVVEKFTNFVANDVIMKKGEIFLITGPNMSGKSTYMRMYALIVYLAQIGSYVPAQSADIPLYDALFTRIGSSDDLSGGKSTFMVEMVESNDALMNATNNSLILFDEIGRGTATYDGMALAQGMVEYIHEVIKAQTFFSTHYHELTDLANKYERISNLHVAATLERNNLIFMHQVKPGASDKSYGIQVASLANLPKELIKRSEKILKTLENKEEKIIVDLFNYEELKEDNLNVISYEQDEVLSELAKIDLDQVTPLEALIILKNYQNKLNKK